MFHDKNNIDIHVLIQCSFDITFYYNYNLYIDEHLNFT